MNGILLGDFCRKRAEEISGAADNAEKKNSGKKDMCTPQGKLRTRRKDRWTAQKRRAGAVSSKLRTAKTRRRQKHLEMHQKLKLRKGNSLGANRLLLVFVCSLVSKYDVSVKAVIAETAWLQGVGIQRLAKIYQHYDEYGEVYDPDDKRKYKVGSTGHYTFHRSHYGALDWLICTKVLDDKGKKFSSKTVMALISNEFGIKLSRRQVGRIMNKLGYKYGKLEKCTGS